MATNKTAPTSESVTAFLSTVADETRKQDCFALLDLMSSVSGEEAVMWGASIVGFGKYRYKYASGREGEHCPIGFSPRKNDLVIYMISGYEDSTEELAQLGKHKLGKSCLYIKRLSDIDVNVLEKMLRESLKRTKERYPG
ncbi:MAG: DUF1801 domain-containing protein [Candidatus Kapabacteria bacterium]|jgi:hypothetical protein|nr:DUF1801 domain-containing protein [Candidatus Kapabacteria bacterium]